LGLFRGRVESFILRFNLWRCLNGHGRLKNPTCHRFPGGLSHLS
jgi:hypothetical protein